MTRQRSSQSWKRSRQPHFLCQTPMILAIIVARPLLREALRIGFQASAGPFRSLARLAVEPRSLPTGPAADGAYAKTWCAS